MSETSPQTLYCYIHPNRETVLRCNRCERPICNSCAVLTPTGYRCKECVRSQLKVFDTARWIDYPLAVVTAGGLALAGSLVTSLLGFFILILAPVVGVVIAEAVRLVTARRRSILLYRLTAAGAALGSLATLLPILITLLLGGGIGGILSLVWKLLYAGIVTSTVYYRVSGIQIR
jgi:hypothetical protein